jgi:hypothetical protein
MLYGSVADPEARQAISDLKMRWRRLVKRGMPVHLRRIVFTQYPGAKKMAGEAYSMLPSTASQNIRVIGSRELQDCRVEAETATLVVSACLDETYELMSISRELRTVQPGGNTTYAAPIFRASSKYERNRVEANLTFGEHGAKTFNLYSVVQIELPACDQQHSWKLEFARLQEMLHWADLEGIDVPMEIERRLTILRAAAGSQRPRAAIGLGLYDGPYT